MVKLSLLFIVVLLISSSRSSPVPSVKCSAKISSGEEKIFIGDILKNHKCKPTDQFMVLYTDEKIFDEEVLHNNKAQSVCAGLSSLVLYGEEHQMFDKVCKDATFTEAEDFCKVFLQDMKKKLSGQLLSSGLPVAYINALQSLVKLDEASCDAVCGGLKSEMCSMLVQLGQAFVSVSSDKGSMLGDKSGHKDTVKGKVPVTTSKTSVNKTGPSTLLHLKTRENGSSKISQSGSRLGDNNSNKQGRPKNKMQGPNYSGQRPPFQNQGKPSYQQGGPKQSQNQGGQGWRKPYQNGGPPYQQGGQKQVPYNPNQGRQGWNPNQGGSSYQQGAPKQSPYYQNQGGQGLRKPYQNGGPPYQQGGQKQVPYNPNQGRQSWNPNQGGSSYQQGGPKQSPYNPSQEGQGWRKSYQNGRPSYQQGGPQQSPYYQNQGGQGWRKPYQNGGPPYQQGGQYQPPYGPNQGRQNWNQGQGGQKPPPYNSDQGRQGWKKPYPNQGVQNQSPPQGDQKRPSSYPGQLKDLKTQYNPKGNSQNPNQGGQVPDQKTGISDHANNIPPSGDDKTRNNSTNDSKNKSNQIKPPTPSKTLSSLNTTNGTVVENKSEKNKDTNLGEAPEVTGGPKESLIPFNLELSDKGNNPPPNVNVNDDSLWDNNPRPGDNDKSKTQFANPPKAQPTAQVATKKPTTASQDIIVEEDETYHGYGTWHFITIFLLFAVVVVVAYFLIHNRKKLREGVSGYVSGKNRTRRHREYRPLSQQ